MSKLAEEGVKMTPQLSPKDIPQDPSDSEPEDSGENGLVLVDTSSEEDNGDESLMDPENNGYMPLVQDIADIADDEPSNQSFVEDDDGTQPSNATDQNDDKCEGCEEESADNVSMEQDQVDLIRQVMMNVSLPSAAIPDWANNVPEDKWKAMLVSNIENRNQQKEDTDRNTRR